MVSYVRKLPSAYDAPPKIVAIPHHILAAGVYCVIPDLKMSKSIFRYHIVFEHISSNCKIELCTHDMFYSILYKTTRQVVT